MTTRILSGIRATGTLHLGNLLGAITQWTEQQSSTDSFFFIADLHGLTQLNQNHKSEEFQLQRLKTAATFLACGIDPHQSTLFFQSAVPQHTELMWYMSAVARYGELKRMTQWKEKAGDQQAGASAGLLLYPVLMAADILLYDAQEVPVGEDQTQHVEVARDWAERFNSYFGTTFVVPKATTPAEGARVMDLKNPLVKMSKSSDANGTIYLDDAPEVIRRKIMRAMTDAGTTVEPESMGAGVKNLLDILAAVTKQPLSTCIEENAGTQYGALKTRVADALVDALEPIGNNIRNYMFDRASLSEALLIGTSRAMEVAESTTSRARVALGVQN